MYKNEMELDVSRCVEILIRRKVFIAIMTVLFLIVGIGLSLDIGEDRYTSVATVYAAADTSYNDAAAAVTAMNAYLDVATSYKVSQRAALILGRSDIDAADIQSALSVGSSSKASGSATTNFLNSSATIISFRVTTTDPELSRQIADAAAESYVIEMANILKTDAVKNLDSAEKGNLSFNARNNAIKKSLIIMIAGFVLSCLFVIACEILDKRIRTIREATIRNQIPIIGIIPDYKD
ncbi:Wzz/FepE/Etk N-terminal domain-containing protein [Butyrivibrio sp. VCB2001]|uniref:Wzz/FepE/Etk N-terminal domain-containing protein n=1 Tax=Butyrivibrio sp. VCB2001 TaxID=1280667 RepID=UPI000429481D|nr:Wzz/FepE/Etk N-terminal domain-containing protein [Butyrivibrio sp. VCB2001]